MERTYHPVTGEVAYIITPEEKEIIDVVLESTFISSCKSEGEE